MKSPGILRKDNLATWLAVELAIASVLGLGTCILRHDERQAFRAWMRDPTPATRAVLDKEKAITFRHNIGLAVILFGGMALITVPIALRNS
jgi:hypothetical protein